MHGNATFTRAGSGLFVCLFVYGNIFKIPKYTPQSIHMATRLFFFFFFAVGAEEVRVCLYVGRIGSDKTSFSTTVLHGNASSFTIWAGSCSFIYR